MQNWKSPNFKLKILPYFKPISPYLGMLGAGIWKYYCHIWNQSHRICLIASFRERIKISKFKPKLPYFSLFGLEFLKTIVIFEISTFEFITNEIWTHAGNFCIGSAFAKGPRSTFPEGPALVPGSLYREYLLKVTNISESITLSGMEM